MSGIMKDVRYALRLWRKRPGFTLVVVSTLALGIGANAAIFSVVDAVLLAPLGYRQPERLVMVYSQFPSLGFQKFWMSAPELLELKRWASSFSDVGAYVIGADNVTGGDRPLRVKAAAVSQSLFTTLGIDAAHGRYLSPDEDLPKGPPAVVLGDGLWRRAFAADPALVGKTIEVDGVRRTVVGVMPAGFDLEDQGVELFEPLGLDPANPGGRSSHYLYLIARLKPGVELPAARQELAALIQRWQTELGDVHGPRPERHPLVFSPLKEELVGGVRRALLLLAGAVGFVLLIACANVANLLLARAQSRQAEIALRTALGAGEGRLLRQFLTESVLLALAGGAAGLLLGSWAVRAVLAANPESLVRLREVRLDGSVLLFTLAVTLATGLVFGLAPALHARARGLAASLKEGGRASAGASRQRFRRVLVVGEVALTAALVVSAGLLLRSFWSLQQVDLGFDPRGVLSFELSLPQALYPEDRRVTAFYDELVARLATLPGVEAAAAAGGLPPVRQLNANDTDIEGLPEGPDSPPQNVDYYQPVTAGYFAALGIPIVAGRGLAASDTAEAPPVVVVNQRMAQLFWPGESPIGHRVRPGFGADTPWLTVVGVAGDVKNGGVDRPTGTELYLASAQLPARLGFSQRTMDLVLRTAGDPLALAHAVEAEVRRADPSLPVAHLASLESVVADSMASPRFLTLLVALFGLVALALAAVGTYGVLSYSVEERRHEMGVRLALGASASGILSLVLGQGMRLVAIGLAAGLAVALMLRKLLASLLFGVGPSDPLTFGAVAALLTAVALVACFLPALRATRVDPIEALRGE